MFIVINYKELERHKYIATLLILYITWIIIRKLEEKKRDKIFLIEA